jgi:hypothetical protein
MGVVMEAQVEEALDANLLSTVALLFDLPAKGLVRGQVGTVVEILDAQTWLVEFCDDNGRAYAIEDCKTAALLPLRTTPLAA